MSLYNISLTHPPMLYNKSKRHPQKRPNQKLTRKSVTVTVVVQVGLIYGR